MHKIVHYIYLYIYIYHYYLHILIMTMCQIIVRGHCLSLSGGESWRGWLVSVPVGDR